MGETIKYYRRYRGYDYSRGASLFVTLVTEPRASLFGCVVGGKVVPSELGREVNEALEALPRFNPGIFLYDHVVMPDHVHANLHLQAGLTEPVKVLGAAIRRFKIYTTTCARQHGHTGPMWQQGYHDRVGLSRRFIESVARYIRANPLKYELMYNQPRYLAIHEPLRSVRLDPAQYWKGQGAVTLLAPENKILALRVSRKVESHGRVVSRLADAVRAGYTVLSGFISPGERAVRDMLVENAQAKMIQILPGQMPMGYRPDSRYLPALAAGRYLALAEGNEEEAFCRGACLALNDEIRKIAAAGEGLSVYWQSTGPRVVGV